MGCVDRPANILFNHTTSLGGGAGARWRLFNFFDDCCHGNYRGPVAFVAQAFWYDHDTDVVIVLTTSKPVSAGFISDLKPVAHADNLSVSVYFLLEACIKRTKL